MQKIKTSTDLFRMLNTKNKIKKLDLAKKLMFLFLGFLLLKENVKKNEI